MTRKIPVLSYDKKEVVEKWLSVSLLPRSPYKKTLAKKVTDSLNEKNGKRIIQKIIKMKNLLGGAHYITLYGESFLLVLPERQIGCSPHKACENSTFYVQRLMKNDALYRLRNESSMR